MYTRDKANLQYRAILWIEKLRSLEFNRSLGIGYIQAIYFRSQEHKDDIIFL